MACKNIHEIGECRDSRCKLLHQKTCIAYSRQGHFPRKNFWFVHPYQPPRFRQKERRDGLLYENNKCRYDRQNGNNRTISSQSYVQPNMNANRFPVFMGHLRLRGADFCLQIIFSDMALFMHYAMNFASR